MVKKASYRLDAGVTPIRFDYPIGSAYPCMAKLKERSEKSGRFSFQQNIIVTLSIIPNSHTQTKRLKNNGLHL